MKTIAPQRIVLCALLATFGLFGCGSSDQPAKSPEPETTTHEIKEEVKEGVDEAGEGVKKAGDKIEEKTDKTGPE